MEKGRWEHYSHPSDVGIRGFGETLEEAFEQAGAGLTALVARLDKVEAKEEIEISCEEDDRELLFLGWLNSVIYEMSSREMLFSEFKVRIDGGQLRGRLGGERIDVERHEPAVEVKGATFMDLKVSQENDGMWMAQCVVDV